MQACYYPTRREQVNLENVENMENVSRKDARKENEMRNVYMKRNVISGALGSAYMEMGNTKVVVAIYGPRANVKRNAEFSEVGSLQCDVKFCGFAEERIRERQQLPHELELSSIVTQALSPAVILDKFPKTILPIFIEVLECGGNELSAIINCASLALADACVDMYDLVTASSAVVTSSRMWLDPSLEEEKKADAVCTVAYMSSHDHVTHVMQSGKIEYTEVQEAIELCTTACRGPLLTMMRDCLTKETTA